MSTFKASGTPRSSEKKRVRFKQEAEVREFESLDNPKKARVRPGAMAALEGQIGAVNIDTGKEIGLSNSHRGQLEPQAQPASANTRDHLFSSALGTAEDDGGEDGENNTDWDVFQADAEFDYDEPEQILNEAGVPFEPFNLKEERDAGYFDAASGSYIRLKKKEDVEDAWADALDATKVDAGWAQSVIDRASAREAKTTRTKSGGGGGDSRQNSVGGAINTKYLTTGEVLELKQKIVSLLQPEENVLAALRRLGRRRQRAPETSSFAKNSKKTAPLAVEPSREATLLGKDALTADLCDNKGEALQQRQHEKISKHVGLVKRTSLIPQAQVEFDQLTDWSSVLMEAGEFLIHSRTREELLRREDIEEEQAVAAAATTTVCNPTPFAGAAVEKEDIDMFAEEAERHLLATCEASEQEHLVPCLQLPQPPPPSAAAEEEEDGKQLFLQGFLLDQNSGYYYNSTLGAYYDPASSLFGDAASGRWYRLDQNTGQYILV